MTRILVRLVTILLLATLALRLGAQTDDLSAGQKKLDPAEVTRLRAVLAEPVPRGALLDDLRRHFREKEVAANALGDNAQWTAILREAVRLLPDSDLKGRLARRLIARHEFSEGNALMRQALAVADPYYGALLSANIACDLYDQFENDAARVAITEAERKVKIAQPDARSDGAKRTLFLASFRISNCLSLLEERFGRYAKAVDAAENAEKSARSAEVLSTERDPLTRSVSRAYVAESILRKREAYTAAGRMQDAEKALADRIRYTRDVQLPAYYFADIFSSASDLRFAQREFAQSEQLIRKSDAVLAGLGWAPTHYRRTEKAAALLLALAAQKKWPDALREVQRLDNLAGVDETLKSQVRYTFERAVVHLGNERYADAASLFEMAAQFNRKQNSDSHFFVAQAAGLQGAALWRTGLPENKAKARPLLKAAVRDYMAPANADFVENIGIRKELREIVFAAYLDAMTNTTGEDATQAIGAADWVRGSIVQEALSDAAVRAAASTPALADVVRREQDAKNEVAGIRRYLAGETGSANSPLPVIAAQMRERIAVLEGERTKLQAEIKAKFPDYERLVRPMPPTVQDIARQLDPQQALLMLLPTSEAVYVWAVAADRPAGFVRVSLTEAQVNALVAGLRHQLDFAYGSTTGIQYNSGAAFELYDRLLAPLAKVWQGKTQLIVATGGALSQLPFAVLQTRPGGGFDANAPWLIREASITQVPSLSAWLAIKSLAKSKSASQAFAGWGDPAFSAKSSAATATRRTPSRSIALTRASVLADLEHPEKTTAAPSALKYSDIPSLPDTREELLAIAGTLHADPTRDVLLGSSATRESVLAASKSGILANKRVVAFATHGLMAGDLPNLNQPALAMAATGTEAQNPLAPLLTLEDVLTLKLNADWVVLSACNTAAADGKAEEALSGLARGFFYAGSRSLLVTHWAVDSESAKLLTTATFEHYTANPQAAKAESLRQAMLKVMAMPQYGHPAYWAPYALVGDGGR